MLSHAHVEPSLSSETPSYSPDIVPPPSDAPAAANGAEEKAQRKGSSSSTCDMQAPDAGAGDGTAAKGELGIRGSVASSSCSSLLGALRLASIAEEASPNRDGGSVSLLHAELLSIIIGPHRKGNLAQVLQYPNTSRTQDCSVLCEWGNL